MPLLPSREASAGRRLAPEPAPRTPGSGCSSNGTQADNRSDAGRTNRSLDLFLSPRTLSMSLVPEPSGNGWAIDINSFLIGRVNTAGQIELEKHLGSIDERPSVKSFIENLLPAPSFLENLLPAHRCEPSFLAFDPRDPEGGLIEWDSPEQYEQATGLPLEPVREEFRQVGAWCC